MADVQWIKIKTDMFDNRKIKYLRKLPEGNNIVLIWVMLLTAAGRCNASGMVFLTENIPYTPKMLADELEFEESTVILALEALERMDMIARDNGAFYIPGWEEHQNAEALEKIKEQNNIRKKRQRERQKLLQSHGNVTEMSRDTSVTQVGHARECHATEEDKEKEIEKEKEIDNNIVDSGAFVKRITKAEINEFFESVWQLYPVKKGKGQVSDSKRKALYEIGFDEINRAIERYQEELKKDASWRKPQNGSTFFNSGYVDYLDNNFVPDTKQETQQVKTTYQSNYAETIQNRVSMVDDW